MSGLDFATLLAIGVLVIGSVAIFIWFLVDVIHAFGHDGPPDDRRGYQGVDRDP